MERPFHKLVVATDFSPGAERALLVASELSRLYSAPLTVIHVYDPVVYPFASGDLTYTAEQQARLWAELDGRLASAGAQARDAGAYQPRTRLLQGLAAAEIVRFARDGGFDLIVIGTHGRTSVARVLLGSVAARVVQTAACAVLTVKRPELREATPPHGDTA